MDYWDLFTENNDFIFSHVQQNHIQHNIFQGIKYTLYPVCACPVVTNDPEHRIACVTGVITVEADRGATAVYDFFLLSPSEENHHNIALELKRVTADGIMEPEQAVLFGERILNMFPDYADWTLSSLIPVLEGRKNYETDRRWE